MNELSQVDFFLKIEYHTDYINTNQIIKSIKEIPNIISVHKLNLKNIKNKENLNFS
jgi:Co/Zn/Cd efflux system component